MKDYFNSLKEYVKGHYNLIVKKEICDNINIKNSVLLDLQLKGSTKYIYEHYKAFEAVWYDANNRYVGSVNFIPALCLEKEHKELVDIMDECYDVDLDKLNIVEDITHWYPLFYFPNGDAFCLDIRNGTVVFYEHEVYDGEKNLHGLLIATSINDLYEKWNCFHFSDIYDWSEVVNDEGIDLTCDIIRNHL